MAQVTGRVYITVGGKRLASKEGATLKFGGVERDDVVADSGVVGYMEKTIAPSVECTIAHTADTRLQDFQDIIDSSLSFITDTGRSFTLSSAWCSGALELSKGEVKLKFGAIDCTEE